MRAPVYLLPMSAAAFVAALCSGLLVSRWGLRLVVRVALVIAVAGFAGLLLVAFAADWPMLVFLLLIGASYGTVQTTGAEAIMTDAPAEKAAAIESVAYELGAGLGIAFLGSVVLVSGLRGATYVSAALILVLALLFRVLMRSCRPPRS